MNKRPLISVLIPTYNCSQYIEQAINSVLAQNYPNLEIIVVNDGSTDETAAVVERIVGALRATPLRNRNPIKYFYKENGGIASTRNYCLEKASGELIAWLDADDYYLPEKLAAQIDYLIQNPDCEIVFTRYQNLVENEDITHTKKVKEEFEIEKKLKTFLVSSLARKSVYKKCDLFREDFIKGSDSDFIFRLHYIVNVKHFIDTVFYMRRLHGKNISLDNRANPFQPSNKIMFENIRKNITTKSEKRTH